jgi:hypothetical protein
MNIEGQEGAMATRKFCDRCGVEPSVQIGHLSLQPVKADAPEREPDAEYLPQRFDLCRVCHRDLVEWLRPNPSREPMV